MEDEEVEKKLWIARAFHLPSLSKAGRQWKKLSIENVLLIVPAAREMTTPTPQIALSVPFAFTSRWSSTASLRVNTPLVHARQAKSKGFPKLEQDFIALPNCSVAIDKWSVMFERERLEHLLLP